MASGTVTDDPGRHRYVLADDGLEVGHIEYGFSGGRLSVLHTEIGEQFGGRGYGGVLARGVLDDARARGLAVLPFCPFVRGWVGKHPEYADLVPADFIPPPED